MDKIELSQILADRYKLALVATFVPQSKSRNANKKDLSINWRCTVTRDGRPVIADMDYMQGSGHLPKTTTARRESVYAYERDKHAVETGRYYTKDRDNFSTKPIAPPVLAEVFYSLLSDGMSANTSPFEEWCMELGYDSDSIKARDIYGICADTAARLRRAFTAAELESLQELFSDY